MRDAVTVHLFMSHAVVHAGIARVTLAGELDWDTGPYVSKAVAACLAEQPTTLRLELGDVSFCDCAGLDVLLRVRASALRAGVDFVVEGMGRQLTQLLDLTGTGSALTESHTHTGTDPTQGPARVIATRRDTEAAAAESSLRDLLA